MGAKLAGGGKGGKMQPSSEPNIVPFIDILLVLLIIFMVAAPIPTTDVKVDLPPPVPDEPTPPNPKKPTIVDVRDDGTGAAQIFVDGQFAEKSDLAQKVLERIAFNAPGSPNPLLETIRFRADQTLPYAEVMGTMAILQDSSFTKVSMVAEDAIDESMLRQ
jgi:biopolymer transport protein ExbD